MPTPLGAHNARLSLVRELLTKKGRQQHARFSFEGPTLLEEALRAGVPVEAVYATPERYESSPPLQMAESHGIGVYLVDDRSMARISDLDTPPGIVAVAPITLEPLEKLLEAPGIVLLLADVNDPGNAGTLLRTADAFGVDRVVFGSEGAAPHNPKVVRAAMGSIFRVRLATAQPDGLSHAAASRRVTGLTARGEPLRGLEWHESDVLVVGSERRGLGDWARVCSRYAAIPMLGQAESLNAAAAGSIALYEATKPQQG